MRRKVLLEYIVDTIAGFKPAIAALPPRQQVDAVAQIYHQLAMPFLNRTPLSAELKDSEHEIVFHREALVHWSAGLSPIYKIGETFGKHLNKTDLDVPCSLLTCVPGDVFLLELPDSVAFENKGDHFHSVIVMIGSYDPDLGTKWVRYPVSEYEHDRIAKRDRMLSVLTPDYDAKGEFKGTSSYSIFPIPSDKTLGEALTSYFGADATIGRHLALFIGKCLLYLTSGEPDLQKIEGSHCTSKKEKKVRQHKRDHCPFDVVNVGYDFHRRVFHLDEAQVSGHFRWQRHGPSYSLVKLIWIDEHIRKYDRGLDLRPKPVVGPASHPH